MADLAILFITSELATSVSGPRSCQEHLDFVEGSGLARNLDRSLISMQRQNEAFGSSRLNLSYFVAG